MLCNCDGASECPVWCNDSGSPRLALASIPVYRDCAAAADRFIINVRCAVEAA